MEKGKGEIQVSLYMFMCVGGATIRGLSDVALEEYRSSSWVDANSPYTEDQCTMGLSIALRI